MVRAVWTLAWQYVFSTLLNKLGCTLGWLGYFISFFFFPSSLPTWAFLGLGCDEIWDWIEELLENHILNWMKKKKMFGVYTTCTSMWGRPPYYGGVCIFLWALLEVFFGVVRIVSMGLLFKVVCDDYVDPVMQTMWI